jgi:hypothetical protein
MAGLLGEKGSRGPVEMQQKKSISIVGDIKNMIHLAG